MFITEQQEEWQKLPIENNALKDSGRQFITRYTYHGCQDALRELIVPMALNSSGRRDTVRVLRSSLNTVLRTVREGAAQVAAPLPPRRVKDLEIDEFWSFIQSPKQQHWCSGTAGTSSVRRSPRLCPDANCRRLLDKPATCQVCTFHPDDGQASRKLLPAQGHQVHKSGTQRIERPHLDFRTRIKRLHRRTSCFST